MPDSDLTQVTSIASGDRPVLETVLKMTIDSLDNQGIFRLETGVVVASTFHVTP